MFGGIFFSMTSYFVNIVQAPGPSPLIQLSNTPLFHEEDIHILFDGAMRGVRGCSLFAGKEIFTRGGY